MASRPSRSLSALVVALVASLTFVPLHAPAIAAPAAPPVINAAPTILSTDPTAGALVNTKTPRVMVTYTTTNVTAVSFLLDGVNVTSGGTFNNTAFVWSYPFELADGALTANFTLWDNVSGSASRIWTFMIDTTAPRLEVTSPAYALTNQLTALVAGITDVDAIVTVDGSSATVDANGSYNVTVSLANEGLNTITVVATDPAGNVATVVKTVVRDTTLPTLVVFNPVEGSAWNTTSVFASGSVDPDAQVIVNGLVAAVNRTIGTWSVLVPMFNGPGAIDVMAMDPAGNVARVVRRVLVDTIAPQITLTSPTALLTNRTTVTVSGFVSEPVAALLINSQSVPVFAPFFTFSLDLTFTDGFHPIQVVAVDFAGNFGRAVTAVQVDTTPPTVSVFLPADRTETDELSIRVRGTVSDPTATVVVNGLLVRPDSNGAWETVVALGGGHQPVYTTISVYAVDAAGNRGNVVERTVLYVSPIPDFQNGLVSNRQDLVSLGNYVTYGLIVVLAVLLAVQFALYSKLRKKLRHRPAPEPKETEPEWTEQETGEKKGET